MPQKQEARQRLRRHGRYGKEVVMRYPLGEKSEDNDIVRASLESKILHDEQLASRGYFVANAWGPSGI